MRNIKKNRNNKKLNQKGFFRPFRQPQKCHKSSKSYLFFHSEISENPPQDVCTGKCYFCKKSNEKGRMEFFRFSH